MARAALLTDPDATPRLLAERVTAAHWLDLRRMDEDDSFMARLGGRWNSAQVHASADRSVPGAANARARSPDGQEERNEGHDEEQAAGSHQNQYTI